MRHLLLIVTILCCLRSLAEEKHPTLELPTESDLGGIFLKTLIVGTWNSPPESILIYPVIYDKDGERRLANELFILITADDVKLFYEQLLQPAKIGILPEVCPNIIMERGGRDPNRIQLQGSVLVDKDLDYVKFRLLTGNPIFPTIDFLYKSEKLKQFLLRRQVHK